MVSSFLIGLAYRSIIIGMNRMPSREPNAFVKVCKKVRPKDEGDSMSSASVRVEVIVTSGVS